MSSCAVGGWGHPTLLHPEAPPVGLLEVTDEREGIVAFDQPAVNKAFRDLLGAYKKLLF